MSCTLTTPAPTSVSLDNLAVLDEGLQERLVQRIMKDEEMPRELVERILDQAVGYLRLAAMQPDGNFCPSPMVDIGWHTFILYTRDYQAFCQKITGGRFIHHVPTDDPSVQDISSSPHATMLAMQKVGITVDEPLWACLHGADCGPSGCTNCNAGQGCQGGNCNY